MKATQIELSVGGRPPKFNEPCRPITVTLPERILGALERANPDRARAIVKCVETAIETKKTAKRAVELIEVLPQKALIVVNSNRSLRQIEWLRLVEIAPARYILVLPHGIPIERLEVEIRDLRERLEAQNEEEHLLLDQLQQLLVKQRRQKKLSKGELLLVDMTP